MNYSYLAYIVFFCTKLYSIVEQTDPLLLVVLMVKDEESVIVDTIRPFVQGGVDGFLIYDTGSNDTTISTISDYFHTNNVKNTLVLQETYEDFHYAKARNRALELAWMHFPQAQFIVMPDAEWYIENAAELKSFCQRQAANNDYTPVYGIRIYNDTIEFKAPRLFRAHVLEIEFVNKRHECLNVVCHNSVPAPVAFFWNPKQKGIEKSNKRFASDRDYFLKKYRKNPKNPRVLFYLAQSYECLGEYVQAAYFYKKRSQINQFLEEQFIAWYRLGYLTELTHKNNWPLAIEYYRKAMECCPWRIEPVIKIAEHYLEEKNYEVAYGFAQRAYYADYPVHDFLFINRHDYAVKRYEVMAQAAFQMQHFELARIVAKQALQAGADLTDMKELILKIDAMRL